MHAFADDVLSGEDEDYGAVQAPENSARRRRTRGLLRRAKQLTAHRLDAETLHDDMTRATNAFICNY